jgi:hypothetical protein
MAQGLDKLQWISSPTNTRINWYSSFKQVWCRFSILQSFNAFHAYFSEWIIDDILISVNFRLYSRREYTCSRNFTSHSFNLGEVARGIFRPHKDLFFSSLHISWNYNQTVPISFATFLPYLRCHWHFPRTAGIRDNGRNV